MASDARKLIAGVHYDHEWQGGILGCRCGWNWPEERTWFCGEEERIAKAHAAHVAAEINKALGGLTVETRTNPMSSAGMTTNYNTGEIVSFSDVRRDVRWVSDWSEAQP